MCLTLYFQFTPPRPQFWCEACRQKTKRLRDRRHCFRCGGQQLMWPLSLTSPAWNIQSLPMKYLTPPHVSTFRDAVLSFGQRMAPDTNNTTEEPVRLEEPSAAGSLLSVFSEHLTDLGPWNTLNSADQCLTWNSADMTSMIMVPTLWSYWMIHKCVNFSENIFWFYITTSLKSMIKVGFFLFK